MNNPKVISLGEALIDMISTEQGVDLEQAPAFHRRAGGAPANVAVGLSKLGVKTGFIGKVGDDHFGHFLESFLRHSGVSTDNIVFTDNAHTTLAFVSLTKKGDRDFAFFRNPGADELLRPEELDQELIRNSKVLHFGSLSLTGAASSDATFQAIDYAQQSDSTISFDPNLRHSLWKNEEEEKAVCKKAVSKSDLLKLSDEEAKFLTGNHELSRAADKLSQLGPQFVIVTKGEGGCYYHIQHRQGETSSFTIAPQDTTGAGDAFTAGLYAAFDKIGILEKPLASLNKPQLERALQFANATAAITTTQVGATKAFPDRSQVEDFIKAQT